jgi:NodT family efflux transporter outer membrane factor (OMF) lipoprotein
LFILFYTSLGFPLRKKVLLFFSLFISAIIAGCVVGPDFHRPDPPGAKQFTETPLPNETVGGEGEGRESQRFVSGKEIPSQWWTLYHSPPLDELIRQSLADSPTISAAESALRAAQEIRRAALGVAFSPQVDAAVSARRQEISGADFGQPDMPNTIFNLYNASVNVSYNLNVFGGAQRGLEVLQSEIDYQQFQLEGAHLTLTANIVTSAVNEALLRAQIGVTEEAIVTQGKYLEIVERQFQLGGVSRSDVLAQKVQLAQARAALPPLQLALAQARHRLAALSGKFSENANLPEFDLKSFELPREIPVTLPSLLVRQRPDVLASEALFHKASGQLGVATANQFPQFTLSGGYGSESAKVGDLFSPDSMVWNLGAGLIQPLFHGGELTAKKRAAGALFDQAASNYRQTVLLAFQNVADVLRALEYDGTLLAAQGTAESSAREALDLTERQFQLGGVSYLSLLNAERQNQLARLRLVQALAARYADTAALFQALGGGWWNNK